MPAYAVIGAQWGDEGKGKVVDYLAGKAHCVARYAGGNNAGHTVVNEDGEFTLHLVPSGILRPQVTPVIGNGVVVDPDVLLGELKGLSDRGVDVRRLAVSDRAHVVMPYHVRLDSLEEKARGSKAIGTTGTGIGPAYMDKASRIGVRVGDLLDPEYLRGRLDPVIDFKNALMTKVYGAEPISADEVLEKCFAWGNALKLYVRQTELVVQDSLSRGEGVLLEGAQGTLLDLDHGTYPYVTSSNPSIGGACTGLGLSPREITGVTGVFKAYSTRVGGGPLTAEMEEDTAGLLREKAWEYGVTTGRARRIGWFDAVAGRYSATLNGFTSLVLTRLDVLDGFPSIKVCVGYDLDGQAVDRFPTSLATLEKCRPIYEEMPGWDGPTASATDVSQLPPEATAYINRIEELIGCPIHLVSTGPRRWETIVKKPVL